MSNIEGIFSIRLVIADFYLEKPTLGLDPCYSEFRGKEIKRVPIIRIFGSNGLGQKTCMHVHGVFPYFYIPYDRRDFETPQQAFYKIATNVDKAINISLGQASSGAQHVFKVQVVKGFPFYGYHRNEHQFLKIHMFNPRFVRRAANLLQSGAIMGKNFHPHESHVPYLLQFMIDYNLYGMSFLHVPMEIVKFRRNTEDDEIPFANLNLAQILNSNLIRKQTVSALEVDIAANFILNRFQMAYNNEKNCKKEQTNPGVEAIWHDEKIRRQKLIIECAEDQEKLNKIPPLEIPGADERPPMELVQSELFYRAGLLSKLDAIETSLSGSSTLTDQTLNQTELSTNITNINLQTTLHGTKEQKKTFNLKKILANAVYPDECSDELELMNASHIENHISNRGSLQSTISGGIDALQAHEKPAPSPQSMVQEADSEGCEYTDDTIIDEELVLSLTQSHLPLDATLRDEDVELLDVLQQLETEESNEEHKIDLDSTLAPFQDKDFDILPDELDKETLASIMQEPFAENELEEEAEEKEHLLDFSVAMDDLEEMLLKWSQSQPENNSPAPAEDPQLDLEPDLKIPQLDGADDTPKTPKKSQVKYSSASKLSSMKSPKRSPRTPKVTAASKYTPLPLIISSVKKNLNNMTPITHEQVRKVECGESEVPSGSLPQSNKTLLNSLLLLQQQLATIDIQSKNMDTKKDDEPLRNEEQKRTPIVRRRRNTIDMDRTHITCNLMPRRKSERLLKVCPKSENMEEEKDKNRGKESENVNKEKVLKNVKVRLKKINQNEHSIMEKSIEKANEITPIKMSESEDEEIKASDDEENISARKSMRKSANLQHLRRSFFSNSAKKLKLLYSEKAVPKAVVEKPVYRIRKCKVLLKRLKTLKTPPKIDGESDVIFRTPWWKTRRSDIFEPYSPSVFSDQSSPSFSEVLLTPCLNTVEESQVDNEEVKHILRPLLSAPTREEALEMCHQMELFEYEHPKPHYSNAEDVGKSKEVGFMILQIPGNKLNDLPEYESFISINGGSGILAWRRNILLNMGGTMIVNRLKNNLRMREYCASQKRVWIAPHCKAPSRHDAKLWLKARELLQQKGSETAGQRNVVDEDSPIKVRRQRVTMMMNEGDGQEEELDCSMRSITLTPLTPTTPFNNSKVATDFNETPLSKDSGAIKHEMVGSVGKRKVLKGPRAKLSLTARLKAAVDVEKSMPPKSPNTMINSQNSDSSIGSDVVLAALERSSFMCNLEGNKKLQKDNHNISFGLSHASLDNTFGFKVNLENLQQAKADVECNYLTIICLEVFVPTRDDLYPNPEHDEVRCIFYAIENNVPANNDGSSLPQKSCGYIILNDHKDLAPEGFVHGLNANIEVTIVKTEIEAIETLLQLCARWDPDIFAGYEIEMNSWGYILERAKYLCINIAPLLSRVPTQKVRDFVDEDRDQLTDLEVEMKLCGRILLDVWRLMRSEIALTSYTFENVMYHIMHKRTPWHSYKDLTNWYITPGLRWITLEYYLERVRGTLGLLDQLDLLGRTAEMAKLMGIQFYEVLSRGSQFRVESMMLRIAKPKNLVPLSPSVQQRAHMRAPEYLPLIMEPQSRFYADPLIVLDFQSLYPSMIIAYNYCFSTCLGRVEHLGHSDPFEFGAAQLKVPPALLKKLIERDLITISPCGVVFVKSEVREGILPRMLTEILDTRQMVKQSMKLHKNNTALQRILHSRQLGLKLMANVTYGYTAANFSGRMPSVEVGDSVVAKGRETLERAMKMVETNEKWKVKVVYGDTDSLFVLVPGRSREQAFRIGEEIAEAVTKANPFPVKLKLEKIYQPSILQTKKRYVGFMYETADQTEPIYEAKGIETVRRDGCPAVAKMLEKVLRILFETTDVSQVKRYVCRQFTKLLSGRANLQDLIFAKEFRGLNGYKPTACVPALEMTRKWMQTDPRRIPRRGERVPFIITNGPPGVPLIRMVRCPREVLKDGGLKINAIYYITKAIIPPLNRCLLLIGADVNEWFANLPRKILMTPAFGIANKPLVNAASANINPASKKSTISQYFSTSDCVLDCGRQTKQGICAECAKIPGKCHLILQSKIATLERGFRFTEFICQSCSGRSAQICCGSLDCPVIYVLETKRRDFQQVVHYRQLLHDIF